MYNRNDYRYYLERRLYESDDFLAHYGVKGMKWKQHKVGVKLNEDWGDGSKRSYIEFNKRPGGNGHYQSDKIGIIRTKNKKENSITAFNTTNKKYFKDDERLTKRKHGRLSSEYAEDGSQHTLDLSRKRKKSSLRQRVAKYRKTRGIHL